MESLPHPFLHSIRGKLEQILGASKGSKWLPPLQAALRQLNLSESEQESFLIDFHNYAERLDVGTLEAIPPSQVVPFLINTIWSAHARTSKSTSSEHDSSSKTGTGDDVVPPEEIENSYEDIEEDEEEEAEEEEEGTDGKTTRGSPQDEAEKGPKRYKLLLENIAPFYIEKWHEEMDKSNPLATGKQKKKFSRALWRHIINHMEPEYRLPTLILKKHQYIRREEPRNLGPGCYDPHFYEHQKKRRLNLTRGQMYSCTPRFAREMVKMDSPDPGAYGNPWDRIRDKPSFGKVPLLQSGPCDLRAATFKQSGSALGPGDYEVKSSVAELLKKRTSRRGPYDLFTQKDRFDIIHGFFKRPKMNTEPGMYGVHGNMIQRINDRYNILKGRLSRVSRDAKSTGERITLSHPMWPSSEVERMPGPGSYEITDPKYHFTCWGENYWAFNISTEARPQETSDYDNAPTRYRPELAFTQYCARGCGFRSNFISKAQRLDPTRAMVLSERLRPKDIPPMEKHAKISGDCSW